MSLVYNWLKKVNGKDLWLGPVRLKVDISYYGLADWWKHIRGKVNHDWNQKFAERVVARSMAGIDKFNFDPDEE